LLIGEALKIASAKVRTKAPGEDDGKSYVAWTRCFSIAMDTLAQSLNGCSESRALTKTGEGEPERRPADETTGQHAKNPWSEPPDLTSQMEVEQLM